MDTENKEVSLPETIKQKIRKSVGTYKQILENDKEFAEEMMYIICNPEDYIARDIANAVYDRNPDIIKKCQEEYKPFPLEITKLRKIISFLFHLASGDQVMIMDELKDCDHSIKQLEVNALAKLCIKEINYQYNPNVEFTYNIDPVIMEYCTRDCMGEDSDPEAI